jgi:hypothetical protein
MKNTPIEFNTRSYFISHGREAGWESSILREDDE